MLNDAALRMLSALQGLTQRFQREDGQTLAEYSLIVTTIAVAVVVLSVIVFRDAIAGAFNSVLPCLTGSC